jgi:V8-like Glu-specific endopeptidase
VLNENNIQNNKIIKFTINDEKKREIKINKARKKYTNIELDITFIEIKPNIDNINNFMELDNDINKDNNILELDYEKKSIYILHYPKGELSVSYGLIDYLEEAKKLYHCCNTEEGSSGSPILSLKTYKVIGIHHSGNNNRNVGTFIKYALGEFKKNYNIYKNKIKLIYKINKNDNQKIHKIFGKKFVENNKNNIDLIIKGKTIKLVSHYELREEENNITIIIKNKK